MRHLILYTTLALLFSCTPPSTSNKENEPIDTAQLHETPTDTPKEHRDAPKDEALKVKLYFATWSGSDAAGHPIKTNSKEVVGFNTHPSHRFCYDSQIFDKLVINGNADSVTLIISQGTRVAFKRENMTIHGSVTFETKDFTFGIGEVCKLVIMKNERVVLTGTIDSESCL